jgi:Mrp family chromosome partitioning ATPase
VRVETIAQWAPPAALDPSSRRGICQQLYPQAVDRCLVVAVIAVPESVDHKSRVAAELALALGESGHPRVLLLEADFHRSRVHRAMGVEMPMGAGFSQQMHARIQGSQGTAWTVVACTSTLHVLAEGVMRSPGLLGSELFAEAVRDLRSYYDFVVIDGPTLSLELDAAPLNAVCDGLVVACPANAGDSLLRVTGLFEQKRVNAVAVVPNGS